MTDFTKPAISVSILTCNRKAALFDLLENLKLQTLFNAAEVIVVDNASQDGTEHELLQRFPFVRHLRLPQNIGCAGRNAGMKEARAEIVVTLDDDMLFCDPDELEKILRFFDRHPEYAATNFKVLDPEQKAILPFNWFHPRQREIYGSSTFETDFITEAAIAFRTSVFRDSGYYPEDFFLSHEGYDLAYRMINRGHRVAYCGEIATIHMCAPQQRTSWRNAYYDTRNYFWLILRNYPLAMVVTQIPYRLATTFPFCLSRNQLTWYGKAIWDSARGAPEQWRQRDVLTRRSLERLRRIRALNPSAWYRLRNFFKRMKIFNRHMDRDS
jgi:GT2 family glycosyltransferase